MLKIKMQSNNNNEVRGNLVRALNGTISLDEVINDIIMETYEETDEEKVKKENFMIKMDEYAKRYLTDSERMVYCLFIKDRKTIAEIKVIMNFGCWYTAESHVLKIFKIIRIYHDYHDLDLKVLNTALLENFTEHERKLIRMLHNRMTYNEITEEVGSYYRKIYYECIDIFERLESLGVVGEGYVNFLKEIRKFKNRG